MPLIPELDHVKHITVSVTRLLGPLENGTTRQFGTEGWDTSNALQYSGGPGAFPGSDWFALNDGSVFSQRFVFPTQSVGRILIHANAFLDAPNPQGTLYVNIYTDTTKAGSGPIPSNLWILLGTQAGPYALGGAILGTANVGIPAHPDSRGSGIAVPFPQLNTVQNALNLAVELEPNSVISPGQPFWIAFSTSSAGNSNVQFGRASTGAVQGQPSATSTNNGSTWTGGGRTLNCTVYPQLALSSTGATGYGNGNNLTVWDDLGFGKPRAATSPIGAAQSFSQIDFDTSFIVTKSKAGRVDGWTVTSAGTSVPAHLSRMDYTMTIIYEKF